MTQQLIDIGVQPNSGTGDSIRDAFEKVNDNFTDVYTNGIPGSPGSTGPQGPKGDIGPRGPAGLRGTAGAGVPIGGTEGQILAKASDVNYATTWIDSLSPFNITNDSALNSIETTALPLSSEAIDIVVLDDPTFLGNFRIGQPVRIFGASANQTTITTPGTITSITKNGFVGLSGTPITFSYKIAQFEYSTGKVSAASTVAVDIAGIYTNDFGIENNIQINITRSSTSYGILIYRQSVGVTYNLIAVLGSKELGSTISSSYIDYYNFDYNYWSGKSETTNEFTTESGLIHFSVTAPTVAAKGWVDTTVISTDSLLTRVRFASSFYFNPNVIISHNDTALIQNAIDSRTSQNLNSLEIEAKTYIVSELIIPSGFSIFGKSRRSLLRKLSWSSSGAATNKIFRVQDNLVAASISISNLSIEGNMQNQFLINDVIDSYVNYAIDIRGSNHKFDNISINNVIGGGITSTEPQNIVINLCQIENGGLSDRYAFSPLIADSGREVLVTNNVMKNFSDSVDVSINNTGILNGNIVSNCGSGVLTFGSTSFVSSPNVLLGPAGEFIQGPDTLNSEYDSVNIFLEPNTNFVSASYVYQENGDNFSLSANRGVVSYRLDKLRKVDNVEELYGQILISGINPLQALIGTDLASGEFRFSIASSYVNTLASTYSYSTLKAIDNNHVGLIYRAFLTEYVPSGTITAQAILSPTTNYRVTLSNPSNLSIGTSVRLLNHGGTPDLDGLVGTIIAINTLTNQYTIQYASPVTVVGNAGTLTVQNTFVLAKGKIL